MNPTKAYKKNMSDERDRGLNLWMVMREQETRVHVAMETSVNEWNLWRWDWELLGKDV